MNQESVDNFSFEIENCNNIEIPKNHYAPIQQMDIVELPQKDYEIYDEVKDTHTGAIHMVKSKNKVVIGQRKAYPPPQSAPTEQYMGST